MPTLTQLPYDPPEHRREAFNCPHCLAYSQQRWSGANRIDGARNLGMIPKLTVSVCSRCGKYSLWFSEKMIFPPESIVPPPNSDLDEDIQRDYSEAQSILSSSPRGAAALLRLAIQKICKHLGESGGNINEDIASLVKKGLGTKIQQALDIVRVVGNNAVHPGQIDISDNEEVARSLFALVNLIAEVMITQPKNVQSMYDSIVPERDQDAIEERDANS